jgi:hypothetical protein
VDERGEMRFPFRRKRAELPPLNVIPLAEKVSPETRALVEPPPVPFFEDWRANDAVKIPRSQQRKTANRYNFEND